jgi:hypothetical protein
VSPTLARGYHFELTQEQEKFLQSTDSVEGSQFHTFLKAYLTWKGRLKVNMAMSRITRQSIEHQMARTIFDSSRFF